MYTEKEKKELERMRLIAEPIKIDAMEEMKIAAGVDNVNHPSHYETGKFECIDVMLETQGVYATQSFCICNAFKYLYRHNGKNGLEDIRKAIWYLNKFIELEEENTNGNDNKT